MYAAILFRRRIVVWFECSTFGKKTTLIQTSCQSRTKFRIYWCLVRILLLTLRTLRTIFLKLKYPENLINSTITRFTESQNQQQVRDVQANAPVRIILPSKDQRSADVVRRQLFDLGKPSENTCVTPTIRITKILTSSLPSWSRGKYECLVYEMLFIQEIKPKLNTQSDSLHSTL